MKKLLFFMPLAAGLCTFLAMSFLGYGPQKESQAATDTVTVSATVLAYLSFSITAGDTVAFGDLTPGTEECYATGTVATVSTNAANGYTLGVHDGSGTDSPMTHTDTTTKIPDVDNSGTIASPATYGASNIGLGIGLYASDTTKEGVWGTGTTVCDTNNKYAVIPATATTAHTAGGGPKSADTSSWSFKLDVANTQKTGSYSGDVTFTATEVLS
jgi:hypothetical protein